MSSIDEEIETIGNDKGFIELDKFRPLIKPNNQKDFIWAYKMAKAFSKFLTRTEKDKNEDNFPFMRHLTSVSYRLLKYGYNNITLASTMLHDIERTGSFASLERVFQEFNYNIAKRVYHLSNMAELAGNNPTNIIEKKYNKEEFNINFMMGMLEYSDLLPIKVTDNVDNLKTIKNTSPSTQKRIITDAINIFDKLIQFYDPRLANDLRFHINKHQNLYDELYIYDSYHSTQIASHIIGAYAKIRSTNSSDYKDMHLPNKDKINKFVDSGIEELTKRIEIDNLSRITNNLYGSLASNGYKLNDAPNIISVEEMKKLDPELVNQIETNYNPKNKRITRKVVEEWMEKHKERLGDNFTTLNMKIGHSLDDMYKAFGNNRIPKVTESLIKHHFFLHKVNKILLDEIIKKEYRQFVMDYFEEEHKIATKSIPTLDYTVIEGFGLKDIGRYRTKSGDVVQHITTTFSGEINPTFLYLIGQFAYILDLNNTIENPGAPLTLFHKDFDGKEGIRVIYEKYNNGLKVPKAHEENLNHLDAKIPDKSTTPFSVIDIIYK